MANSVVIVLIPSFSGRWSNGNASRPPHPAGVLIPSFSGRWSNLSPPEEESHVYSLNPFFFRSLVEPVGADRAGLWV